MSSESASADWLAARRKVVRDALSLGLAVGTYGISFGALATTSGLSVLQACAMSVLTFTGGSQFALVGVLGAGGSGVTGTMTALLLGLRNTMYGLRIAPVLKVRGVHKAVAAHFVIDESTAMTIAQDDTAHDGRAARLAFWLTGLTIFVWWNIMTFVGAAGATALGDPEDFGLDAAVGAAFLALVWPQLRMRGGWLVAGAAAAVALLLTPWLTPGVPVLVAGVVGVAAGLAVATTGAP